VAADAAGAAAEAGGAFRCSGKRYQHGGMT
jgi:hypothetical protein